VTALLGLAAAFAAIIAVGASAVAVNDALERWLSGSQGSDRRAPSPASSPAPAVPLTRAVAPAPRRPAAGVYVRERRSTRDAGGVGRAVDGGGVDGGGVGGRFGRRPG